MTERIVIVCDHPGCVAYTNRVTGTAWTLDRFGGDRCPDHPDTTPSVSPTSSD